jgi:predicted metal-dependent hydrolase
MKPRTPQLTLRLDAATPDPEAQWCAGAAVAYLGSRLTLVLDTTCRVAMRIGDELHVPLPPAATARQICDAVESWLREEALRLFTEKSALAGRQSVTVKLTFGKRGDWARLEGQQLRCHWRLIEQPLAVISQVLTQALARQAAALPSDDLFALA